MAEVLVLGAGNGGFAMAADLAIRGHKTTLYNRTAATLSAVKAQGGISYTGVLGEGFAPVNSMVTDLEGVVARADLIVACVPATAHRSLARILAHHIREGQKVLLNPGGMLGSLAFLRELRDAGHSGNIGIAETGTLTYICRKPDPGSVFITNVLKDVPCAAFPASSTKGFLADVADIVPNLKEDSHILAAGFANVNAVLHPPAMVLGAAWIEHTQGDFRYYLDAATPAVAHLMEALDTERRAVASGWGVDVPSFPRLFASIGSTSKAAGDKEDYLLSLLDSVPNHHIKAPPSLDHRYMHEDLPYGLVPMIDLGRAVGVPTPTMTAVVQIACASTKRDYWDEARTLASLGLEGWSREKVLELLKEATGWI